MKKQLLTVFIFSTFLLSAQKQLHVNEIWEDEFSPNRMESLKSMKDGNQYTIIDIDMNNSESKIISRHYDFSKNEEIKLKNKILERKVKKYEDNNIRTTGNR